MNIEIQTSSQNRQVKLLSAKQNIPPIPQNKPPIKKVKKLGSQKSERQIINYKNQLEILKKLGKQMDKIYQDYHQKIRRGNNLQEQNETLKKIKQQIQEQQKYKKKLKNKCIVKQRKITENYDDERYSANTNQLKYYTQQLQQMKKQKKYLQKILKTQKKAYNQSNDREALKKKNKLELDIKQHQNKNKQQMNIIHQQDRKILHLSNIMNNKTEYFKKVSELLQKCESMITITDLESMRAQYEQAQEKRQDLQKYYYSQMSQLNREKQNLKNQLQNKQIMIKQKKREDKINKNRLKALKNIFNSIKFKNIQKLQAQNKKMQQNNQQSQTLIKDQSSKQRLFNSQIFVTHNQENIIDD